MATSSPIIVLHPADDIAIARQPLTAAQPLKENVVTKGDIPFGHKVALHDIAQGAPVRRYNQIIGFASQAIQAGEHVHLQNLEMGDDFQRDYAFCAEARETPKAAHQDTFMGIRRADGRVATRNYIGVLSSVNCSATVLRMVSDHFTKTGLTDYPNVDGVVSLPHGLGCATGFDSDDVHILRRTIGGYARHVNFAGVVIIGLGCETNQIGELMKEMKLTENQMLQVMTIQETGGTAKTAAKAIEAIERMLPIANEVRREPMPVSELMVALECGGSDSCSGISANPVLGYAVDKLVAQGGTAILSETPEIYGAEHLLTRRAVNREVGEKLVERILWWEDYCARNNAQMNNNPSAGNKVGGLTTILEKSLGAVAKAGSTNLTGVYRYAEQVTARGLVFMDTPGYDPVAVTGQIAGGANMLCFTTGRGSAFGCKPSPSIKLATNSVLWKRQEEDMDLNCGGVIDGDASIESLGEELYHMLLDVASGKRTKSEQFGYGGLEFVPWQTGAMM